ncbi:MAG: hypothetical protein ABI599_12445 [Flavobacteriales bacterium]
MFLVVASCLSAQTSVPFIGDSTRIWTSEISGSFDFCNETLTTSHWFDGDSVITGTNYARVRGRALHRQWPGTFSCQLTDYYDLDDEFVREDSGMVYALIGNNLEAMIYNFNAVVGDSIPELEGGWGEGLNSVAGWKTVLWIDSVVVGGAYRKRMVVDSVPCLSNDTVGVIQGIGGPYGPFSSLNCQLGISHDQRLICVHEQGAIVFGDSTCTIVDGVEDRVVQAFSPAYPNPSSGSFSLDDAVSSFEVSNRYGSIVLRGFGNAVQLPSATDDVYFLRSWNADGVPLPPQRLVVISR